MNPPTERSVKSREQISTAKTARSTLAPADAFTCLLLSDWSCAWGRVAQLSWICQIWFSYNGAMIVVVLINCSVLLFAPLFHKEILYSSNQTQLLFTVLSLESVVVYRLCRSFSPSFQMNSLTVKLLSWWVWPCAEYFRVNQMAGFQDESERFQTWNRSNSAALQGYDTYIIQSYL